MNQVSRYLHWCFMHCDYAGWPRGWLPPNTRECKHHLARTGLVCSPRNCVKLR